MVVEDFSGYPLQTRIWFEGILVLVTDAHMYAGQDIPFQFVSLLLLFWTCNVVSSCNENYIRWQVWGFWICYLINVKAVQQYSGVCFSFIFPWCQKLRTLVYFYYESYGKLYCLYLILFLLLKGGSGKL